MDRSFGLALKDWRRRRRVSQLALSGEANVSARHIAFLETGRARPSRGMVLQLSEALAIPRAERNALLQAAGFAPAYKARDFADADVAALRQAMDWTLSRHDPYPAMALDRHWKLVALNRAAAGLLAPLGLGEGESLLAAFASAHPLWTVIENASETARHLAARLRVESAHVGGDPVLDAAARAIAARVRDEPPGTTGYLPAVLPTRLRMGDRVLSFFSTIAQFGSAEDIALSDLRLELLFPADEATRGALVGAG